MSDTEDYYLSARPPGRVGPRRSRSEARARMIDFAKAHPGEWITYRPHPDRDTAAINSIRAWATRGYGGGFDGGPGNWQTASNPDGISIDLRYIGPEEKKP